MHSCIYEGRVQHRRFGPHDRKFSYRLFMMYVDLEELPSLFGRRGLWSTRLPALAWFRRADHLGPAQLPLDEAVRQLVDTQLGFRPQGPIRLLTNWRYFGVAMNPISVFYCFAPAGKRLDAVVAEVTNTPWGERHYYALDMRRQAGNALHARCDKQMHVSPFLPMGMHYDWALDAPGDRLRVGIRARGAGPTGLAATLALKRVEISRARLAALLLRYPAMTLKVLLAIYWQAARLWWAGAPFHVHPKHRPVRTPRSNSPSADAIAPELISAESL